MKELRRAGQEREMSNSWKFCTLNGGNLVDIS
jgi:hypothetical protein